MRAGQLRHSVTLQRPGGTQDALGQRVTTWTDVATVNAKVEPLTGRDAFLARQMQASTTHRVTMRWMAVLRDMDASWRVLWAQPDGRDPRLLILSEPPKDIDERDRVLELMCTEGLTDQ